MARIYLLAPSLTPQSGIRVGMMNCRNGKMGKLSHFIDAMMHVHVLVYDVIDLI